MSNLSKILLGCLAIIAFSNPVLATDEGTSGEEGTEQPAPTPDEGSSDDGSSQGETTE